MTPNKNKCDITSFINAIIKDLTYCTKCHITYTYDFLKKGYKNMSVLMKTVVDQRTNKLFENDHS